MSLRSALVLLPHLPGACEGEEPRPVPGGIPGIGAAAIQRHGCGTCHRIPGIPGATGATGPALVALDRQAYVAGVVPNEPDRLIAFIMNPQAIDPRSAMPNLGIGDEEARHIAAYLYAAGAGG